MATVNMNLKKTNISMKRQPDVGFSMQTFAARRTELARRLPAGSGLILVATPEATRNSDVHHAYRPESNIVYLTGWEEPQTVFVFRPGCDPETVLFVRRKDKDKETWDGFRYGPEGAIQDFNIDQAYTIDELDQRIVELLKPLDRLYHRWNINPDFDLRLLGWLQSQRVSMGRTGRGHLPVYDAFELIGEMRLFKSAEELKVLREAARITANGHVVMMQSTRPGINERSLHGRFLESIMDQGASREGYGGIVASGQAATTLHYVFNDQPCRDGDLILVDCGAEYQYYSGDITRCFPANGKWTEPQSRFYQKVLDIQKHIIAQIRVGMAFKALQEIAIDLLTEGMIELGLLKGDKGALIQSLAYKPYYPHGVSHWLGMDVHDSGLYWANGESRPLEPGMVFTIEPGLYVPLDDDQAPVEYRGLGVRIEDDIAILPDGRIENMTVSAPKEISDIERLMAAK